MARPRPLYLFWLRHQMRMFCAVLQAALLSIFNRFAFRSRLVLAFLTAVLIASFATVQAVNPVIVTVSISSPSAGDSIPISGGPTVAVPISGNISVLSQDSEGIAAVILIVDGVTTDYEVPNDGTRFNAIATLTPGPHTIRISAATEATGTVGSKTISVTVMQQNQSIAFWGLPEKTFGWPPFDVAANSSSGLTVSFSSLTPGACSVSGEAVTIRNAGTCTIAANQAGNGQYGAALQVNQSFTIHPSAQSISNDALPDRQMGDPAFSIAPTSTSGLPVAVASQSLTVCTLSGNVVNIVGTGVCSIKSTQGGDANYSAAIPLTQTFAVIPKPLIAQTITFAALPGRSLGASPFGISASSSSGLSVSFSSQTPSVCSVAGATVSILAAGTCAVAADQAGNATYHPATRVSHSFQVELLSQTINFPQPADKVLGSANFPAFADSTSFLGVSFSSDTPTVCTVSGGAVAMSAVGSCTIVAAQGGDASYSAAVPVTRTFQVTAVPLTSQTINFPQPAEKVLGAAPFTPLADSTSYLAVSFSSATTNVCMVSGSTVIMSAVGNCTIVADQAGNATYSKATPVTRTFRVTAAALTPQTINFPQPADKVLGAAPFAALADSSSFLPVSFTSATATVCTVSGGSVAMSAAGSCTIVAAQGGNATYSAAAPVSRTFQVTTGALTPQTINFPQPAGKVLGAAPFVALADSTSSLPISFSSATATVCTVTGDTVAISSLGACTIVAAQGGNATYSAAAPVARSFQVTAGALTPQTISFTQPVDKVLGSSQVAMVAESTSFLTVSFTSSTPTVCTVSGSTVSLLAVGICEIVASQNGNATYGPAMQVQRSFAITAAPTLQDSAKFISQTVPATMRAGQPYTVSVTMQNNGAAAWPVGSAYKLGSQSPQDNHIWLPEGRANFQSAVASGAQTTFTFSVTAPAPGTYPFVWQMVKEYVAWFGESTPASKTVVVAAGAGPTATLTATPTNVRMIGSTPAAITFVGKGTKDASATAVTKIQLLVDANGAGYSATVVKTVTGSAASLTLNYTGNLTAGFYQYKVRVTDANGVITDSAPVLVNVTDSSLLGQITGIQVNDAAQPVMVGWTCETGKSAGLAYTVYLDAPTPETGGMPLTTGIADVATEPDSAAVQSTCSTPGAGHHFNIDLSPYTETYAGRSLFVTANAATGGAKVSLPCKDNNCTMPGSMRIGLSSPSNNVHYKAGGSMTMQAVVSGAGGPVDEVAFSFDGGAWVVGAVDTGVNTYYLNRASLVMRSAPYTVQARVRKGSTVIYSVINAIYVDSADPVTVVLTSPQNGAMLSAGVPVGFTATAVGPGTATVQFFKDGGFLGAGNESGGTWSYLWPSPMQGGPYLITARAYNASAVKLGESSAVSISVLASAGSASDFTPIPVTVAPPAYSEASDVGTLPGELSVDKDGTANYGIPIVVPPGSAGVQPSIALNYSSASGNSQVGLGWALSGLSSIHRCGKTIAQDGVNDRIAFAKSDRLCMDGARLVLVNGVTNDTNYWSDTAVFRTELDQFSRISAKGVLSSQTRWFKVEQKDGRIFSYGTTASSVVGAIVKPISNGYTATGDPMPQPGPKGSPLSWAVAKIVDRFGNFIDFDYAQDTASGEHRPTFIRYGGSGLLPHAAVAFTYTARPDSWKRYVDEARNDLRSRLTHIKTYVAPPGGNLANDVVGSGTIVRDYVLEYEQSPTSGRSLLSAVQVKARDPVLGTMLALPKTTFAWGKPDPSKPAGFQSVGKWNGAPILTTVGYGPDEYPAGTKLMHARNHSAYYAFADFENHGRTDILEKRVANPYAGRAAATIEAFNNPIKAGTQRKSYRYFHNNGRGFDEYTYKLNTNKYFVVLEIGDFNGDGAPDLLVSESGNAFEPVGAGMSKICLSPLGKGTIPAIGNVITFVCDATLLSVGNNTTGGIPYVVDVLGDGRAAHYGGTKVGAGILCIQDACNEDANYPVDVVGEQKMLGAIALTPERTYIAFQDMIDFAGTGKANSVRWSQAYHQTQIQTDDVPQEVDEWYNLQPRVTVNTFIAPGTSIAGGNFASYMYKSYPRPIVDGSRMPYRFEIPYGGAKLSGDFNGSGYTSVVFGFMEMDPATQAPMTRAETTVCLSTGRGLDCSVRSKYSGNNKYNAIRAVADFVGDGQPSILVEKLNYDIPDGMEVLPASPTGQLQMCRLLGDDTSDVNPLGDTNMVCEPWTMLNEHGVNVPFPHDKSRIDGKLISDEDPSKEIDHVYYMDLLGTGRTQLVYYHSGVPSADGRTWDDSGAWWEVFAPRDVAVAGQALDRLVAVRNGLGASATVEYSDNLNSGVIGMTGATTDQLGYPQRLALSPGKVVSKLIRSNGVAADRSESYRYLNPGIDLQGRGSLGFGIVKSTDDQTLTVVETRYAQRWPYTGMTNSSKVTAWNDVVISSTTNIFSAGALPANPAVIFPFIYDSAVTEVEMNSTTGAPTKTIGYTYSYDGWGNLVQANEVHNSISRASDAAGYPDTVRITTSTTFGNTESTWLIGRPTLVEIDKLSSRGGGARRRSSFTNSTVTGMPVTQTRLSDYPDKTLTLTYGRNTFGLVTSVTTKWTDPSPRVARTKVDSTTFDPLGRYPATKTHAVTSLLNQSEQYSYDPATGAQTKFTGPNGLPTIWTVDGFGRVKSELGADGNEIRRYLVTVTNDPAGATVASVTDSFARDGSNNTVRTAAPTITYTDHAGHLLRTKTWGFDINRAVISEQRFDSLGRLWEVDQPRFEAEGAILARRVEYDALGRITDVSMPDAAGTLRTATTRHDGLVTTLKNMKSQKRIEVRDGVGDLREVVEVHTDPALTTRTFLVYEPFGGIAQTAGPGGEVTYVRYDDLGNKSEMDDPALGVIQYFTDPFGRTWKQIGNNHRIEQKATTFQYDLLGRMTARIEPDLKSYWVYDQQAGGDCAASKSCGQLVEANTLAGTAKDYVRLHTYDQFGKPKGSALTINEGAGNATYTTLREYDNWGRPIRQTYQRNTDQAKVFDIRYNNTGALDRVERGSLVLWRVGQQDAAMRNTSSILGNGLVQARTYDPFTGRVKSSEVARAGSLPLLTEGYSYDVLGNVMMRSQRWDTAGYDETFEYDNLNRLVSSDLAQRGKQFYKYDVAGNLTSKTGVGSAGAQYVYPAFNTGRAQPHGVRYIEGNGDFTYDGNGNMLTSPGRTHTWTSFDMPIKISRGNLSSTFVYGPEHQRTRQTRSDKTVLTYAGAQEVETATVGTSVTRTVRTYWPLGLGMEVDRPGHATELDWVHTDRLDSPVLITDQSGAVKEKLAYDAWGKRREINGNNGTPDAVDGKTDNKGFTGHEMLDQLDLVHMNGRVYDPLVARFLSADPFVQDPSNGQSHNRYSYVLNNPTNLTDPTGFKSMACGIGCVTIYQAPADTGSSSTKGKGAKNGGAAESESEGHRVKFKIETNPGNANDGTPVTIVTDTWTKPERYYGTPGEVMAGWGSFDLLSNIGRDMGASERQLYWLGMASMVLNPKQIVQKGAGKITQKVMRRKSLGRDGAESMQVIEKLDDEMISRTHIVRKDGEVLHQHQNHTGKYGGERQFPDEWTGTTTKNAPYENIPPSFKPEPVAPGTTRY